MRKHEKQQEEGQKQMAMQQSRRTLDPLLRGEYQACRGQADRKATQHQEKGLNTNNHSNTPEATTSAHHTKITKKCSRGSQKKERKEGKTSSTNEGKRGKEEAARTAKADREARSTWRQHECSEIKEERKEGKTAAQKQKRRPIHKESRDRQTRWRERHSARRLRITVCISKEIERIDLEMQRVVVCRSFAVILAGQQQKARLLVFNIAIFFLHIGIDGITRGNDRQLFCFVVLILCSACLIDLFLLL